MYSDRIFNGIIIYDPLKNIYLIKMFYSIVYGRNLRIHTWEYVFSKVTFSIKPLKINKNT